MASYECTLSEESAKKALDELYEDPKERDGAVNALRDWALQQPWLTTPTDTSFLLSFLRMRKFSQLGARDALTNYWTIRSQYSGLFKDNSPSNAKIQEFLDLGVYLMMPGLDKFGRKVMLDRQGQLDLSLMKTKFTVDDILKAGMCLMDCCMMDENVQVNGFVVLVDQSNFTHGHEKVFGIENTKRAMNIWSNGYPARFKGIHIYNAGPLFETIFAVVKLFIKEKIRNRMHMHGKSLVTVYENMDMGCLPDEYLPDSYTGPRTGSVKDIIKKMKEEFARPDVVEHIRKLNSGKYGVDLSLKPKDSEPAESFRKLNVS